MKSELFPLVSQEQLQEAQQLASKQAGIGGRAVTIDDVLLASNLHQLGERYLDESNELSTKSTRELFGNKTGRSLGALLLLSQTVQKLHDPASGRTVNDVAIDLLPTVVAVVAIFSGKQKLRHGAG